MGDATFKVNLPGVLQLYVIHINHFNIRIPAIFVPMKNKSATSYEFVF